ncbi:MAG: hypothetical protein KGY70_17605, partial [Bacteroidales bacterium]|nr:hypothetical protein [Bacteroidales bacterium]
MNAFSGYDLWYLRGTPRAHNKRIMAVEASSGEMLWVKDDSVTAEIMPTTTCLGNGQLFFQNPDHVVCLEAKSGNSIWKSQRPIKKTRLGWSTPTLVYHNGVVYSADRESERENEKDTVRWIPSSQGGIAPEVR